MCILFTSCLFIYVLILSHRKLILCNCIPKALKNRQRQPGSSSWLPLVRMSAFPYDKNTNNRKGACDWELPGFWNIMKYIYREIKPICVCQRRIKPLYRNFCSASGRNLFIVSKWIRVPGGGGTHTARFCGSFPAAPHAQAPDRDNPRPYYKTFPQMPLCRWHERPPVCGPFREGGSRQIPGPDLLQRRAVFKSGGFQGCYGFRQKKHFQGFAAGKGPQSDAVHFFRNLRLGIGFPDSESGFHSQFQNKLPHGAPPLQKLHTVYHKKFVISIEIRHFSSQSADRSSTWGRRYLSPPVRPQKNRSPS